MASKAHSGKRRQEGTNPFGLFSIHLGLSIMVDKNNLFVCSSYCIRIHSFSSFFLYFFPMWVGWGFQPQHKLIKGEKA